MVLLFANRVEISASRGLAAVIGESYSMCTHTLQFGCVLVTDFTEIELIIANPTEIVVQFHLFSDLQAPKGMQNISGLPVFLCVPSSGIIEPGMSTIREHLRNPWVANTKCLVHSSQRKPQILQ